MSRPVLPLALAAALFLPSATVAQGPKIVELKPSAAMSGSTYVVKIKLGSEGRVGMSLQVRESASTDKMLTVAGASKLVSGGQLTSVTLKPKKSWFPEELPAKFVATLKVTVVGEDGKVTKTSRELKIRR